MTQIIEVTLVPVFLLVVVLALAMVISYVKRHVQRRIGPEPSAKPCALCQQAPKLTVHDTGGQYYGTEFTCGCGIRVMEVDKDLGTAVVKTTKLWNDVVNNTGVIKK